VAGYNSRCPAGKSKTIHFISALFLLNYQSRSDANFSPARPAGSKSRYERDEDWSAGLNVCDCLRLLAVAKLKAKSGLRLIYQRLYRQSRWATVFYAYFFGDNPELIKT